MSVMNVVCTAGMGRGKSTLRNSGPGLWDQVSGVLT